MSAESEREMVIAYRVIGRVGTDEDGYWMEMDKGLFTRMPREYGPEPTMVDALRYGERFDRHDRLIRFYEMPWSEYADWVDES